MEVTFDPVPLVTYPITRSERRTEEDSLNKIRDSTGRDQQNNDPPSAIPNGTLITANMILYIGAPSLHLTNILLTHASIPVRASWQYRAIVW